MALSPADFAPTLLAWYATHHRPMPWKGVKNPYWIWLSEIILQQTRVAQGLPYFERFVAAYPTVKDLADAPQDEVLKHWEGLGYYSRARNLHHTAQHIAYELAGQFPDTYEGILQLKGVGPYTAAAIASFAYDLPHAVVDGNVYRVLARVFGMDTPIDSTEGKRAFGALAQNLIDPSRAADYNQAIMDFGATQCTPKSPNCQACPFAQTCVAYAQGRVLQLPFKSKKLTKRTRYFYYLVLSHQGRQWVQQRTQKDIWQGLYEYPLIEVASPLTRTALLAKVRTKLGDHAAHTVERISPTYQQQLTHQTIVATFVELSLAQPLDLEGAIPLDATTRKNLAWPKTITRYLGDKSLYLDFS